MEEEELYYFKKATDFDEYGKDLMEAIHRCCEHGTGEFQKVHTSGQTHLIKTNLKFQPLGYEKGSIILNKLTSLSEYNFNTLIHGMNCGDLNTALLAANFYATNTCSLLKFIYNPSEGTINLNTLLVFRFNPETKSIEVLSFCCDKIKRGGGGVIFNFFINAVKCGLSTCTPDKYDPLINLDALQSAIPFYEKYGLEPVSINNPSSLRRLLSGDTGSGTIEESTPTLRVAQSSSAGRKERGRSMVRESRRASGERSSSGERHDYSRSRSRDKKGGKRGSTRRMSKRKIANKKNRKSIRSRYR
jgi:hypothetical protein